MHDHARPATEWPVVDTAVVAACKVTQRPQAHINQPRLESPARDAVGHGWPKQLWKQRDDVYTHGTWRSVVVWQPVHGNAFVHQTDTIDVLAYKRNKALQLGVVGGRGGHAQHRLRTS